MNPLNWGDSRLPFCVTSSVSNESVTVSDSANSFVGAYTGNYYSVNRSSNIGGGNVLEYVSPDQTEIVARGTVRYWGGMIERAARFKLVIKDDGLARAYKFHTVEVAQINSGSWPNNGFSRAAMNPGTGGGHVLKNMQQLANTIDSCLTE
jgi:hypothetical protein